MPSNLLLCLTSELNYCLPLTLTILQFALLTAAVEDIKSIATENAQSLDWRIAQNCHFPSFYPHISLNSR